MSEWYQDFALWEDEHSPLEEEERIDAAAKALSVWYETYRRDLPWRKKQEPYAIWISEIMLQQTRVEAVKPYFERFLRELPDLEALASVEEERLLKLWEGLGYYSRARNLKKAAQVCMEKYEGRMPETYEELLKLPGIGSYTAGAIASIAYKEQAAAVDGNVLRVIHRLTANFSDISSLKVKHALEQKLSASMRRTGIDPGICNQSLMELGACVCLPNGEPLCKKCPVEGICLAKREGLIKDLPVKAAKKQRRVEERTIFLVTDGEYLVIRKRPQKGLLAGLYELPSKEGFCEENEAKEIWESALGVPVSVLAEKEGKHIFSHVEWHMKAWRIVWNKNRSDLEERLAAFGYLLKSRDEIREGYAIPAAFLAWKDYWK